jgi:hypothetical protein
MSDDIGDALDYVFTDEPDRERDNFYDALDRVARALRDLGNGNAATSMGAIEAHGKATLDSASLIADGLGSVARAIERLAEAVERMQS